LCCADRRRRAAGGGLGHGRGDADRRRTRFLRVRPPMPIIVNLDVMLARRKMRSKELAERIGITEQNVSLLKSGKVKGVRFETLDAICSELRGAMVADGYDDAEGELLRRIRAVAGPDVPVVGTLDLHVNMSDAMLAQANLLSAYRTYPHVDWGETGARVARWLERMSSWGARPARAMRRMPFLIPVTAGCSMISPARELYQQLEAIEIETGVHP